MEFLQPRKHQWQSAIGELQLGLELLKGVAIAERQQMCVQGK